MNKILLIIKREYLTRVRQTSFMIMSLAGPLLFTFFMIIPMYVSMNHQSTKTIIINDPSGSFQTPTINTPGYQFIVIRENQTSSQQNIPQQDYHAYIVVPDSLNIFNPTGIYVIQKGAINKVEQAFIKNQLFEQLKSLRIDKLISYPAYTDAIYKNFEMPFINTDAESVYDSSAAVSFGLFASIIIYFFIFMYSIKVMRGVIEEKTNRIIELIISSVKPYQLMAGKIVGIGLVSLTQFGIWLISSSVITFLISNEYQSQLSLFNNENIDHTISQNPGIDIGQAMEWNQLINTFGSLDFPWLISMFLFYFIAGYLLYSALFAAIGSMVSQESDTQQFILPVTLPLLLSFFTANMVFENPDGQLAKVFSIFPLTSPVSMMIRLPFGVSVTELIASVLLLIVTVIFMIYLSGKIYHTGILMYGKKVSVREALKWLFLKN